MKFKPFRAIDLYTGSIIEYPVGKSVTFKYDFLIKGNKNENIYVASSNDLLSSKEGLDAYKKEAKFGYFIIDNYDEEIVDFSKGLSLEGIKL